MIFNFAPEVKKLTFSFFLISHLFSLTSIPFHQHTKTFEIYNYIVVCLQDQCALILAVLLIGITDINSIFHRIAFITKSKSNNMFQIAH